MAKGPSKYPRYMYGEASEAMLKRAHHLEALCKRYNVPLAALALQFSLNEPRIASTIVGMSRPERLHETLTLAQTPIPPQLWEEVRQL